MIIELELGKSVDQNASQYFEKAKKLKKKMEGVKKAIIESEKRLEKAKKIKEKKSDSEDKAILEKSRKKEWHEKFRWFFSSDNFLVIGGKDASSNELIIKKHLEPNDLVFHTEAAGSPFFIIKNPEKKDIPDSTLQEVASATLTYSRAWGQSIKSAEVYQVNPDQISKEAITGEFIQKGAFMVYGKRTYYKPLVSLGCGLLSSGALMCGPLSAVKKNCDKFVELVQGDLKKGDISKILMKKLNLHTNDDIIAGLPTGNFRVVSN